MLYEYHEICLWLPHKPETVEDIAADIKDNGFRPDRAIVTYEGKILDGRHRYEAALEAGVDPVFTEFSGDKREAINYVTSENVARRHLNNKEKEYFYIKSAAFFGVQSRGGERGNQYQSGNPQNCGKALPQGEHAKALGVHVNTITSWEKDRKEIVADEELAEKAKTPEGYQEAKKTVKERRVSKQQQTREAIANTVAPNVIDLHAIAKDKSSVDIRNIAPAFVGQMEMLCTKFDELDIKMEIAAFMHPDPLGLKVKALHEMANILDDLRADFPVETQDHQKLN